MSIDLLEFFFIWKGFRISLLALENNLPSISFQGEQLGQTEATETFFAMTKLFQSKDVNNILFPDDLVEKKVSMRVCVDDASSNDLFIDQRDVHGGQ